jgi:biopolymer transport protein TolQ
VTDLVKTTELAGNVAAYDTSILGLIGNADTVVKIVIFMLLAGSVWSWAIIFDKFISYRTAFDKAERFEKLFWSGQMLQQLYDRIRSHVDHPMASVFVIAMDEWARNAKIIATGNPNAIAGVKSRLSKTMENAVFKEINKMETNLNFLAILSSAAPFVGLFGTVWGIMHSFQGIAALKSATLAVVAPGIAEALLATAIGLIAAIPAGLAYGFLYKKLDSLSERLEGFTLELENLLSRELDEGTK